MVRPLRVHGMSTNGVEMAMRRETRRAMGMTRRRLEIMLVAVLGAAACDEDAEDAAHDDTGDGDFRVNEPEPTELVVETSDLGVWLGKPLHAPCPACGKIVARGTHYVDVLLELPGNHGHVQLDIGLDQPNIVPAVVNLPSSTASLRGTVRLRSSGVILANAPLMITAWDP